MKLLVVIHRYFIKLQKYLQYLGGDAALNTTVWRTFNAEVNRSVHDETLVGPLKTWVHIHEI